MLHSSKKHQKIAKEFARRARQATKPEVKQKLEAQAHKFETLAKMAQKQEAKGLTPGKTLPGSLME